MGLTDDTLIVLDSEYKKLHNLLIHAQNNPLLLSEIIELYYQVMNVSSLSFVLNQSSNIDNTLSEKIQIIKNEISDTFNSKIHLQITEQLTDMIQDTMKKLSSDNSNTVSKTEIQSQSHLYDVLRQQMSTREFVEQYDRTLSNN